MLTRAAVDAGGCYDFGRDRYGSNVYDTGVNKWEPPP
jgi:hypothetical protein